MSETSRDYDLEVAGNVAADSIIEAAEVGGTTGREDKIIGFINTKLIRHGSPYMVVTAPEVAVPDDLTELDSIAPETTASQVSDVASAVQQKLTAGDSNEVVKASLAAVEDLAQDHNLSPDFARQFKRDIVRAVTLSRRRRAHYREVKVMPRPDIRGKENGVKPEDL